MAHASVTTADVLAPAFRRIARLAAGAVALLGAVVAAGWVFDVPWLRDFLPWDSASMKPNSAVGFLLSGAALWLLCAAQPRRPVRIVGSVLASAVGLLGLLTLVQDVADVNLGIDQLLVADEPWAAETGSPGRMSPNASLALLVAGASLLLLPTRGKRAASTLQLLATLVIATGLLAVLGYLYGVEGLHRLEYGVTGISLETAFGFMLLGLGVLFASPDRGWMVVFAGATFGGYIARRLLPALAVVIILLGWLRLEGELGNLFESAFGTALFVLATILLLGAIIWQTAVAVHRSDLQRLEAERDVLEQREWLATTLLSIGDAVITTDARGRTVLMNGVAEALTGWSAQDGAGRPLVEIFRTVDENTGEPIENPVSVVLRRKEVVGLANHAALVRRDGHQIPIQDSAAPIRRGDGRVIGVVLVFRDVSRARRAEQELRASEAVKGAIIRNSLDAIITVDEAGSIIEFNPAAETMFGHTRQAAVGQSVANLLVPVSRRQRHMEGFGRLLATGEGGRLIGRHVEVSAMRADGSEFPVELAVTPIPTGERPLFAAHVRDITERKRFEHALKQRANQQRAVVRLGQMALRERDLQKVLQQAAATLAATLDLQYCGVLQLLPERDRMVLRAGVGWEPEMLGAAVVSADPSSQAGFTLTQNSPLIVQDLPTETRFSDSELLEDHGVQSGMSCTIVGPAGEPWGVLGAHSTSRRRFTEDDISFLSAVANVLANAIERDEAEASLRRSERLYRGIGESINYGVWVSTPDGRAVYASPSFHEMTGLTQEEATGLGWAGALHPDEIEPTLRAWKETMAHGDFWEREHRYRGVDGQWHHVLARGVPIRDDDGNVIYWAGINLDIDDLKRAEEALRESEERFRELAETIREVFYVIERGVVQYVSSAYEVVWGRSRRQLSRSRDSFLASVVDDDRPRLEEARERQSAGEATDLEYRIHRSDGDIRWIHDRAFPIRGETGEALRIVGVANDVTERKRHEEQMRSVMGELNHRVKNTLAVIQSIALQTARRAPNLDAFQKSFQDRLMAMANAHSLLTQTQWEGAALRDIISSELDPRVASPEQYRATGPNIRLRPKPALALHMVVHELATNAGKYGALSSDSGRVDISWQFEGGEQEHQVLLTWTETSPTSITEPMETGYGTKLVDQLIQYELDGQIEREYRPEGLQCRIRFELASRDVTVSAPPAPTVEKRPRSADGDRVLVVEDNSMLAMTLCDELEEAGFSVVGPAGSLARAMALAERAEIDAAVLDVDLDGTAVYPLARRLRDRGVPFLLVTGYELSDLPTDLRDVSMLRKPAQVSRIRSFLEDQLRPV